MGLTDLLLLSAVRVLHNLVHKIIHGCQHLLGDTDHNAVADEQLL